MITGEAFSNWLLRSGRRLPGELQPLVPPPGLTFAATVAWIRNELYRRGEVRYPANLLATLTSALRSLQDEHSAATGLPVVEGVETSIMAVPERAALNGLIWGDDR